MQHCQRKRRHVTLSETLLSLLGMAATWEYRDLLQASKPAVWVHSACGSFPFLVLVPGSCPMKARLAESYPLSLVQLWRFCQFLSPDLLIAGLAQYCCGHKGNNGKTIQLTWGRQRLAAQVFLEAARCQLHHSTDSYPVISLMVEHRLLGLEVSS